MTENFELELEEFYKNLESPQKETKKTEQKKSDGPNLLQLWMNAPNNQGKIGFIPIPDKNKRSWVFFDRMFQLKVWMTDINDFKWHRLLPKEYYPDLTAEESALYDEVIKLGEKCMAEGWIHFKEIKKANYGIIFGYVLSHTVKDEKTKNDKSVDSSINKPAILIFPSYMIKSKIDQSVKDFGVQVKGDKTWILKCYNRDQENRQMYVISNFVKAPNNGKGYDVSCTHVYDNPMTQFIPADLKISDEEMDLFSDVIKTFNGYMNDPETGRLFDSKKVNAMKSRLVKFITEKTKPIPTETMENKNAPLETTMDSKGHVDPLSVSPPPPPAI